MSDNLATIFGNLKTAVLGTKSAEIDKSIDRSLSTISRYSASVQRNDYIETIKNIVGNVDVGNSTLTFLKDVKETRAEFFDRSGRIQRYAEYDHIGRNIAHCSRALNLLTDVIMSPDDISKRALMISLDESYEQLHKKDNVEKVKKDLDNIKKSINIENYVDKIIRTTLKKGDYFIEIIHSPKGEQAFTILTEQTKVTLKEKIDKLKPEEILDSVESSITFNNPVLSEDESRVDEQETTLRVIIHEAYPNAFGGALSVVPINRPVNMPTQTSYPAAANTNARGETIIGDYSDKDKVDDKYFNKGAYDNTEKKEDAVDMKDIFITLHNPRYVIRLQTERFKSCLGYLVFPKIDPSKLASIGNFSMINTDIDALCLDIVKQLKTKIQAQDATIINNSELKNAVLTYLSTIEHADDLKIRYVAPDKMSHFRVNYDLYDPYGESIFDCVLFDCKVFMALKTAQTIKRLTSSTDKRIIKVETGLPHNAKNLVEMLKENMKKRKISIDKFGSIDTIPSIISTFEDIYVPTRDGKEFVSIDNLKWGGDPQDDIEPLKFIRDNIVANLGVPPAFIGLEENSTNRNLLTAESVVFARTIVAFQKQFANCFHDLFTKIYNIIYPTVENEYLAVLEHVNIAFSPPKAALYEHTMEYLDNASRAISTLKDLGVPLEYLKKTYLSFLDWDAIEKYEIEEKMKKGLENKPETDTGMGGMGAGMGSPGMGTDFSGGGMGEIY